MAVNKKWVSLKWPPVARRFAFSTHVTGTGSQEAIRVELTQRRRRPGRNPNLTRPRKRLRLRGLLEFFKFGRSILQDRGIWVGIFPQRDEILVSSLGFGVVFRYRRCFGDFKPRQRSRWVR